MHFFNFVLGILLDDLRAECCDDIKYQSLHYAIDCGGDGAGGVEGDAEKHVDEEVDALLARGDTGVAIEVPAREGEHGLENGLVPHPVEVGLLEVAQAVHTVDHHDGDRNDQGEHGIELELVEVAQHEQIDDAELEQRVEDLDIGIHVHLLVRDDAGVVGRLGDAYHRAQDAELVHPVGGLHAAGGYHELVAQEPQTHGLAQHHHHEGNAHVDDERAREGPGQTSTVATSQLEGEEAACGTGHGGVEEAHHGYHAAHHAIDAVVLHAQGVEHHARGVEAHDHGEEHAQVECHGVFGDAAVA